uniref:Uncharacterized protein n=1 Tax=Candidatus Kentrum sp. LFY TaxID=2126342 RepID=A0A450X0N5_9GAMM|nr:MAG: hypothetical protein BECKLFY1418C_GA0070996_11291 [Candidatus Kentron sp. LFY]
MPWPERRPIVSAFFIGRLYSNIGKRSSTIRIASQGPPPLSVAGAKCQHVPRRAFPVHTITSTMVMVSLPKISTTFTAILRRPGATSRATLVRSRERSFLVRKLCHSFSKI